METKWTSKASAGTAFNANTTGIHTFNGSGIHSVAPGQKIVLHVSRPNRFFVFKFDVNNFQVRHEDGLIVIKKAADLEKIEDIFKRVFAPTKERYDYILYLHDQVF